MSNVTPLQNSASIEAELAFMSALGGDVSASVPSNPAAKKLEKKGYRAWYREIFGKRFVEGWAEHHEEAIKWHWDTRLKILRGEKLTDDDYTAYLAIWSRGHMKSTVARRIAICDAALSASYRQPGYCLYVGGTNEKKIDHATSIGRLLQRRKLLEYYPALGAIQKTARGHSEGDQKFFRYLASGYVFRFVSLDSGIAGGNIELDAGGGDEDEKEEGTRPTFIVPDDIDARGSSAQEYANRALRFTTELLPMRQWNTLLFGAQNLIQRNTIFYQIYKNIIPALARRFPTKPIPAAYDLVYEVEVVDGVSKAMLKSCRPTWPATGFQGVQDLLWELGPEAFKMECQHEVEARKTGLVLNEYNSNVNVISWSMFQRVYGTRKVPRHWTKYTGHDWGNTHANVTSTIAVAAADSALPGLRFLYAGITAKLQSTVDEVAIQFIERHTNIDCTPVKETSGADFAKWGRNGAFSKLMNAPREIAREMLSEKVSDYLAAFNFYLFAMSHEQKIHCNVYNESYGIPYEQVNPGATGGITEINRDFKVDMTAPDPFRPGEFGLATLYLVVADEQYEYEKAVDDYGLKLWRDQFLDWSWRETKLTENGLSDDKPAKVFDDCGNSLMMLYTHSNNLAPAPLTPEQQVEAALPEVLQAGNLNKFLLEHGAQGFHAFQRSLKTALEEAGENEGFTSVPNGLIPLPATANSLQNLVDQFSDFQISLNDPSTQPKTFRESMLVDPDDDDGYDDDDD